MYADGSAFGLAHRRTVCVTVGHTRHSTPSVVAHWAMWRAIHQC